MSASPLWSDKSKSWLDGSKRSRESASQLRFGWEPLAELLKEPALKDLIAEHFEEIAEDKGDIPLDIQWDYYLGLEKRGILKIWVARGAAGDLAGYWCWFIDRHPNYAAIYAWALPFYLTPEHRGGLSGLRFLTSVEGELKELGVARVVLHEKCGSPLGGLFKRAGYRPYETHHTKVLR